MARITVASLQQTIDGLKNDVASAERGFNEMRQDASAAKSALEKEQQASASLRADLARERGNSAELERKLERAKGYIDRVLDIEVRTQGANCEPDRVEHIQFPDLRGPRLGEVRPHVADGYFDPRSVLASSRY